ncbi:hypothetical protein BFINE_21590 [Bacteroides finegoldii DSM 17565]|nr:hypothetical protein BFINE_21590 [Bacteroides finegoldii DSM 17565]
MKQGQMEWWQPVNVQITKSEKSPVILPFSQVNTSECRVMNMDSLFNANVTDIFRNEYLTPVRLIPLCNFLFRALASGVIRN